MIETDLIEIIMKVINNFFPTDDKTPMDQNKMYQYPSLSYHQLERLINFKKNIKQYS